MNVDFLLDPNVAYIILVITSLATIMAVLSPGTGIIELFEAIGSMLLEGGILTIEPSAIASLEAFGTAVLLGKADLAMAGIDSGEAVGALVLVPGGIGISPNGIASAEAVSNPALATGPVTLLPAAIASAFVSGTPAVIGGAVTIGEIAGTIDLLACIDATITTLP